MAVLTSLSSWPGLTRPSLAHLCWDGRVKPGHDEKVKRGHDEKGKLGRDEKVVS